MGAFFGSTLLSFCLLYLSICLIGATDAPEPKKTCHAAIQIPLDRSGNLVVAKTVRRGCPVEILLPVTVGGHVRWDYSGTLEGFETQHNKGKDSFVHIELKIPLSQQKSVAVNFTEMILPDNSIHNELPASSSSGSSTAQPPPLPHRRVQLAIQPTSLSSADSPAMRVCEDGQKLPLVNGPFGECLEDAEPMPMPMTVVAPQITAHAPKKKVAKTQVSSVINNNNGNVLPGVGVRNCKDGSTRPLIPGPQGWCPEDQPQDTTFDVKIEPQPQPQQPVGVKTCKDGTTRPLVPGPKGWCPEDQGNPDYNSLPKIHHAPDGVRECKDGTTRPLVPGPDGWCPEDKPARQMKIPKVEEAIAVRTCNDGTTRPMVPGPKGWCPEHRPENA